MNQHVWNIGKGAVEGVRGREESQGVGGGEPTANQRARGSVEGRHFSKWQEIETKPEVCHKFSPQTERQNILHGAAQGPREPGGYLGRQLEGASYRARPILTSATQMFEVDIHGVAGRYLADSHATVPFDAMALLAMFPDVTSW
uniref:Uncharacterized protein n=1 Tax=Timema bartmani TaxID=61472 RepID=A0A7R9F230_9NEOP|nr:unnamed protein product [Timema bartmani]